MSRRRVLFAELTKAGAVDVQHLPKDYTVKDGHIVPKSTRSVCRHCGRVIGRGIATHEAVCGLPKGTRPWKPPVPRVK